MVKKMRKARHSKKTIEGFQTRLDKVIAHLVAIKAVADPENQNGMLTDAIREVKAARDDMPWRYGSHPVI